MWNNSLFKQVAMISNTAISSNRSVSSIRAVSMHELSIDHSPFIFLFNDSSAAVRTFSIMF